MQVELSSLEITSTWEVVDSPPNIKPISHIWIYKIKFHVVGTVGRFKVWLVEKGYKWIEGLGYFDVYSFTAKMTIIRLVIALTTINNWFVHQFDVNKYFIHGVLQEDIYITIPLRIKPSKRNHMCKLIKYLYGLKQASLKWNEKLISLIIIRHFYQANSYHTLFISKLITHSPSFWYM